MRVRAPPEGLTGRGCGSFIWDRVEADGVGGRSSVFGWERHKSSREKEERGLLGGGWYIRR